MINYVQVIYPLDLLLDVFKLYHTWDSLDFFTERYNNKPKEMLLHISQPKREREKCGYIAFENGELFNSFSLFLMFVTVKVAKISHI
jgi:hypothetical protein